MPAAVAAVAAKSGVGVVAASFLLLRVAATDEVAELLQQCVDSTCHTVVDHVVRNVVENDFATPAAAVATSSELHVFRCWMRIPYVHDLLE